MDGILYELYLECFPEYPTSGTLFENLLRPDLAHIICARENGETVGYSMIHGNSVSILCVKREYRGRGLGGCLLDESEKYIANSDAEEILLGRGSHYLLQGVPNDAFSFVSFFKNRGYMASWESINMSLSLDNFDPGALDIPQIPDTVIFRFAGASDKSALLNAVRDAQAPWLPVFESCADPVLLAVRDGEIAGFEILSPNGGRFSPPGQKTGCIGCVGVVRRARNLGIGRRMVAAGAQRLKDEGCSAIELRYVELVDWYKKIGFTVTRRQWMGKKIYNNATEFCFATLYGRKREKGGRANA